MAHYISLLWLRNINALISRVRILAAASSTWMCFFVSPVGGISLAAASSHTTGNGEKILHLDRLYDSAPKSALRPEVERLAFKQ